ncbi:MAG: hypothetical protein PHP31_07005 [Lentimicrobiaceae bacterium]|nr:hypothetical protein [Lentimicrobiaceae bacterium]
MEEKYKSCGKACLMTWLSCIAIVISLTSFELELTRANINLLFEIPEWLIFTLWNFTLAGIFQLLKEYIQDFHKENITLLSVSALLYLIMGLINIIVELFSIEKLMILSFILTLILPILFLISGIQVLDVGKRLITGALIIAYALVLMASIILSLYFTVKDNFPLWFYIVGTIVDISFLTFLSIRFRKLSRIIRERRNNRKVLSTSNLN